jgi:hypothetical protein
MKKGGIERLEVRQDFHGNGRTKAVSSCCCVCVQRPQLHGGCNGIYEKKTSQELQSCFQERPGRISRTHWFWNKLRKTIE